MFMSGMLGARLILRFGQKDIMVGLFRGGLVGELMYPGK
jgi:hypothetical protein